MPVASVTANHLLVAVRPAAVDPVELAPHGDFVLTQVLVGIQPGPRLQHDDLPTGLGQLLGEYRAGSAAADDAGVDGALVMAHIASLDALLQGFHVRAPDSRCVV
jgi:hypothetical protein